MGINKYQLTRSKQMRKLFFFNVKKGGKELLSFRTRLTLIMQHSKRSNMWMGAATIRLKVQVSL